MFKKFAQRSCGTGFILYHLLSCSKIVSISADELQAIQSNKLRSLVKFAAQEVPYYRRLFKSEGVDSSAIKRADDLQNLPLLDKETVRKNPEMFRPGSSGLFEGFELLTSGSTGEPLRIEHDYSSLLANVAFGERERKVIRASLKKRDFDFTELSVLYPSSTLLKVRQFYDKNSFLYYRKQRFAVSVIEPIERICAEINRIRPDVLVSYGSFLEYFFKFVRLRQISLNIPGVVLYAGDGMSPEGKQSIESAFGVPVLSLYNAVEAFKIGYTCEYRQGFHVHDDICHLRIVDRNGDNLPCGQEGEIVLSNLLNRGTVLLNYRMGDRGMLVENNCPCGRRGLLLEGLQGRVEDLILLPGGEIVHPRAVWSVFKNLDGILQYQLVQHDHHRYDLTLVAASRTTFDGLLPIILADLRRLLGPAAAIEATFAEQAAHPGKFRPVISNLKLGKQP